MNRMFYQNHFSKWQVGFRLAAFFLVLVLCIMLPGLPAMAASVPESATQTLSLPENGRLKIVVFADTQTTQLIAPDLTRCMEAILDEQQPDLVVYLGDQVEGQHPLVHLGNNEANVKAIIDAILTPTVERGLPFAVVFGNHDSSDSGVAKELQMAYYATFPGCLAVDEGESLPGCGTYDLIYTNPDGSPALHLYFFDSGEYAAEGGYASVSDQQNDWYLARAAAMTQENGGTPVPAFAFQHIIVPEIYNILTSVEKGSMPDALKGSGSGAGQYWSALLSSGITGTMGEGPCPPAASNEFAAWKQGGDIIAALFGHDHVNSYIANVDGIDLIACPGATYASYGDSSIRGVRVIELSPDGSYTTESLLFTDYEPTGLLHTCLRWFENGWVSLGVVCILLLLLVIILVVVLIRKTHRRRRAVGTGRR